MREDEVRCWPKVDLHRHLEGAVRPRSFLALAKDKKLVPSDCTLEEIAEKIRVQPEDERSLTAFLRKFIWLRRIFLDRETLARVTFEAIEDAGLDQVKYLELRMNPARFFESGLSAEDVIAGLEEGVRLGEQKYEIRVGLICGFARDMPLERGEETLEFALRNMARGIRGVDLMGDERIPPERFQALFHKARDAGLFITVHAGEAGGAENIEKSITLLHAGRIGHGTHIFECENVARLVRDEGVMLECCLTSNLQTGAVKTLREHPLPELCRRGMPACINTDDPTVSGLCLSGEYGVALWELGLSREAIQDTIRDSLEHIVRPELRAELRKKLIFPVASAPNETRLN